MQFNFNEVKSFYLDALTELGVDTKSILSRDLDIACKCPVCGDSKHSNKRRLHLYQNQTVINVNCFNGDCSVKNYTFWRFFKEFAPATFRKWEDFRRSRYLNTISKASKTPQLESFEADFDLVDKSAQSDKSKIIQFIEQFEPTTRAADLARFKEFYSLLTDNEKQEFKDLMNRMLK